MATSFEKCGLKRGSRLSLPNVQLRKGNGIERLRQKDQIQAAKVVEAYANEIAQKWLGFFVLKRKPEIRKITKGL